MTIGGELNGGITSISDDLRVSISMQCIHLSRDTSIELRQSQQQSTRKTSTRYMENKLFSVDFVDNISNDDEHSICCWARANGERREGRKTKLHGGVGWSRNHSHIKITSWAWKWRSLKAFLFFSTALFLCFSIVVDSCGRDERIERPIKLWMKFRCWAMKNETKTGVFLVDFSWVEWEKNLNTLICITLKKSFNEENEISTIQAAAIIKATKKNVSQGLKCGRVLTWIIHKSQLVLHVLKFVPVFISLELWN